MIVTRLKIANLRAMEAADMNRTRRSIRLQRYDYSRAGAYAVTICTHNRHCLFGEIAGGKMALNHAGHAALQCWQAIPDHFPNVRLDVFAIMPNHIHGILFIVDAPVGAKNVSPLHPVHHSTGTSKTIGSIVRGFKIGVTKWIRQNTSVQQVWQRNYYEHVIRNEDELKRMREYIINNPVHWDMDGENPAAAVTGQIDMGGDP